MNELARTLDVQKRLSREVSWFTSGISVVSSLPDPDAPGADDRIAAIIATGLLGASAAQIEEGARRALAVLGLYRELERVFYYRVDSASGDFELTHEWHAPELLPLLGRARYARVPVAILPGQLLERLGAGAVLQLPRVRASLAAPIDEIVPSHGDRALVLAPALLEGQLIGIVGLVVPEARTDAGQVALPSIVAQGIGRLVERQRAESRAVLRARTPSELDAARAGHGSAGERPSRAPSGLTPEQELQNDSEYLREELGEIEAFHEIVGSSPALHPVIEQVRVVAATNTTVLISGETGTGKELVARAIHEESPRRKRLLVKVNCAALSAGLVESELFGHEKGAFTGALSRRKGRFELAHGGTLFLDEIGELPLDTQAKLLRVLQERELERVGGSEPVRVDVRVVAATNRNLHAMVKSGAFREDLFYRLSVFPLTLPPLRERAGDIPLLVHALLRRFARAAGKHIDRVAPEAMERLADYTWPGNVRELANVLERAVILTPGSVLRADVLPELTPPSTRSLSPLPGFVAPRAFDRGQIERILSETGWVIEGRNGAAHRLGLHPNTLRSRLKRWGVVRPRAGLPVGAEEAAPGSDRMGR